MKEVKYEGSPYQAETIRVIFDDDECVHYVAKTDGKTYVMTCQHCGTSFMFGNNEDEINHGVSRFHRHIITCPAALSAERMEHYFLTMSERTDNSSKLIAKMIMELVLAIYRKKN